MCVFCSKRKKWEAEGLRTIGGRKWKCWRCPPMRHPKLIQRMPRTMAVGQPTPRWGPAGPPPRKIQVSVLQVYGC